MAEQLPSESPKRFFKQHLTGERGIYIQLRHLLTQNPKMGVTGSVTRSSSHYVHENSTELDLDFDGTLQDETWAADNDDIGKLVNRVEDLMTSWMHAFNRKITKKLYADLEHMTSDEGLTDTFDNNEFFFDEDGDIADMTAFKTIDRLPPGIQQRVLAHYQELLDRAPEEVMQVLVNKKVKFDKRGSRVDTAQFKQMSQLPPDIKSKAQEKYRNFWTQDGMWAESTQSDLVAELEDFGFRAPEIAYSLGYNQGDGASFTASSIDMERFLAKASVEPTDVKEALEQVLA